MSIPVTLDDAKRQLRIELDDASQDDELLGFIADAAAWIEDYTGHLLTQRDVTAQFDRFDALSFREWPIAADAVPIVTYEGASGPVPVTGIKMNISRRPARVVTLSGGRWPALPPGSAITVTVQAGYADDNPVPEVFRRAMLMLIAAYDADREGGDAFCKAEATARRICSGFRPRAL